MHRGRIGQLVSACILLLALLWTRADQPVEVVTHGGKKAPTPEALQAEIKALQVAKVVWREIAWKSCLLEGLKESRAQNKPALLWIFIDRPVDDARC
jgi:hypothetical protein